MSAAGEGKENGPGEAKDGCDRLDIAGSIDEAGKELSDDTYDEGGDAHWEEFDGGQDGCVSEGTLEVGGETELDGCHPHEDGRGLKDEGEDVGIRPDAVGK